MVIPLYDHNPFKLPVAPVVTWGIIAANFAVFFVQLSLGNDGDETLIKTLGVVPAHLAGPLSDPGPVPAYLTLFTCLWLHEGWEHILGNMLFLFVFGDDIEEALGRGRFLVFYVLCGVAASMAFVAFNASATLPLIGASGAIAGVMSAYLLIRPCARVVVALFIRFLIVPVPAWLAIGVWALLQVYYVSNQNGDHVAYVAHVGGLIAGIVLLLIMRPKHVRLLQCLWDPEKAADPAATK
jgi:membrane associated rhomboid family serine protease